MKYEVRKVVFSVVFTQLDDEGSPVGEQAMAQGELFPKGFSELDKAVAEAAEQVNQQAQSSPRSSGASRVVTIAMREKRRS